MRWIGLGLLIGVLWTAPGYAQLAVIDAANLARNSITSVQSTITAIEAVLQTGYMLRELEPFGDTGINGAFGEDMGELEAIIRDTQTVLFDIRAVEQQASALFGIQDAPDSTFGLSERLFEIRRVQAEQYAQARRIQTLQRRAVDTIRHIGSLLERILGFIGQKQAMQNISANLTILEHVNNKHSVQLAAFQQAMLTAEQEKPLIEESLFRINQAIRADWPR